MSATLQKPHNWSYAKTANGNCVTGEATMRTKSLSSEKMEARVARFNKLQAYQRQNFEAHGIPPGAVEKITARRVYPVMAPADYQGRSVGAPVKGPRAPYRRRSKEAPAPGHQAGRLLRHRTPGPRAAGQLWRRQDVASAVLRQSPDPRAWPRPLSHPRRSAGAGEGAGVPGEPG